VQLIKSIFKINKLGIYLLEVNRRKGIKR